MKKIITLSILLLSGLLASAQVCPDKIDHSRVIVGASSAPSKAVHAGLFNARYDLNSNQIALVAGTACTNAYYVIYDASGRVTACGKFAKLKAGEYDIVKLGVNPNECRIVLSSTPFLAHKQ